VVQRTDHWNRDSATLAASRGRRRRSCQVRGSSRGDPGPRPV